MREKAIGQGFPVRTGALAGVRIIELAGMGPCPFAGMMLADHGAKVIRIDRSGRAAAPSKDILNRGRQSIAVNLKSPEGVAIVRDLCKSADGVIEGYRPGVMERLGLGPEELLRDNPRLVYGRMTGWGQYGPYAPMAGHDVNYIAITGALNACGPAGQKPVIPLNLVGDFGGGGMMLAFGMVSAILSARATGQGQVIDCAMVDGVSTLMTMIWRFRAEGRWDEERGSNVLDGGTHFYDCYETADGKYISIGAIEPQFYSELRSLLGIAHDEEFDAQHDKERWPRLKAKIAEIVKMRSREEWCELLEGTDCCFAPVLSMSEAVNHPQLVARETLVEVNGVMQPSPSPRFSVTPAQRPAAAANPGEDSVSVLEGLGYPEERIKSLIAEGVVGTY